MSLPSEQNWLVLQNLIIDLTKKGYEIPNGINPEMGLIRSSISSYKRDPSHPELINGLAKAEMALNNIQGTLLTIAEEEGENYVDYWLDLLKQVMKGEELFEFAKSRSKFLVNTPPGLTTGKINLKVPLAEERVQEIAEWNGLIIEFEDDMTVQLHGDQEDLKTGLKEMGSFFLDD
ncbi:MULTISPECIES: DUF2096 domain-containing protein [Methanobrevibacter]|uniref:DUF2096 family protein n=1 Tax=Methanobrevibacter gottschalkii DSM 11977 TaxID=1122229 RepID=A0A3N5B2K7_9EURY|nr:MULTISPECIES: DUF2096 domain-containing protein [Methanobrevibacter]OEC97091.1 DUF2096 domain-containing protein [Methanobrevibacter sp. A27]RPF51594.1 hypothetical protein EDC42_0925 [Methanobrevibacter gottschalkii DSM 11977]